MQHPVSLSLLSPKEIGAGKNRPQAVRQSRPGFAIAGGFILMPYPCGR